MNVKEFATKMRLRVKRDEGGERIIPGKRGHIYEHSISLSGILFMPDKTRLWVNAKRKLRAAGITIRQDGDEEGIALFDPLNQEHVRLALKVLGMKPRRVASVAQLEALRKATTARKICQTQRAEAVVAP